MTQNGETPLFSLDCALDVPAARREFETLRAFVDSGGGMLELSQGRPTQPSLQLLFAAAQHDGLMFGPCAQEVLNGRKEVV